MTKKIKKRIAIIAALIIVAAAVAGCAAYLGDYYRADTEAVDALTPADIMITRNAQDNSLVFMPHGNVDTALIFYPGGKVEYDAYIPLMSACAEKGIMCILPEMPFNLAVFDADAAESLYNMYPEIVHWYIGGHSLGGSMAASYAADNAEDFEGVVLLASYSTEDISQLDVLSVYGSEDKVLDIEKYEKYKANLPENFAEYVIDGGCHAYFGTYGEQSGDGTPSITNEEQIRIAADEIGDFIK